MNLRSVVRTKKINMLFFCGYYTDSKTIIIRFIYLFIFYGINHDIFKPTLLVLMTLIRDNNVNNYFNVF